MSISEINYIADSSVLFQHLYDQPGSVFLDSGHPHSKQGRYDIITAWPFIQIIHDHGINYITDQHGNSENTQCLFELVDCLLSDHEIAEHHLPFAGGAIGYFAYDLVSNDTNNAKLPAACIGIYDWAIVVDHQLQRSYWVQQKGHTLEQAQHAVLEQMIHNPYNHKTVADQPFALTQPWRSNLDFADYQRAFNRIQDYIHAGDCYQVNLTQRLHSQYRGHLWHAYHQIRANNAAPFAAFMQFCAYNVLSFSPERFLKIDGRQIVSQPIKGTRPRYKDALLDQQSADELRQSAKDFSENVMIVDLIRNDLGKLCDTGSVHVSELCQLHSFTNVHHLISTIKGTLNQQITPLQALKSCFPGGSITGTPKIRAMQIIQELEPDTRGVYCGNIAYIDFSGKMDSNITIRTLYGDKHDLYIGAGGAIIADSDCQQEYAECYHKINKLIGNLQDV